MQFPESWLRSFANPDISSTDLAHKLTMAGLEVDEMETAAPLFSGVVVAKIVSIDAHPNADKLRVCQVDDGSGELKQIVCGAPNARAGIKVPLAQIKAQLPGGFKIGKAKMRGVESFGMLCSARELGISQEDEGLLELDDSVQVGLSVREALNLDEQIITLSLTPNRADCLSIYGVARELAALTACTLQPVDCSPVPVTIEDTLPVVIQASDLCGRFAGRVIRGVNGAAPTPAWMVERLERAGQRSLSALVDISNYVMLELGRPSHVFDLDKIGNELSVRWAQSGESVELLNGQTVTLDSDTGVITSDGRIESLAGIMGAESSAVSADTQNIFLEAAFWWPEAIMGRARRFKFSSEASHRFERGVDYANVVEHLERITQLILAICGGSAGPVQDQTTQLPDRQPVAMRLERCRRILGIPISQAEVEQVFTMLGMPFSFADGVFSVTPPSYRFDIEIEEDLIEEVARIYGFERIPDAPPIAPAIMRVTPETRRTPHTLRSTLVDLDYHELINFSFIEEQWEHDYTGNSQPIRLLNPIASHLAVMRSSLIPGLVANIRHNANRRQSRVRVFEIGRVFWRDATVNDGPVSVKGVAQPQRLAGAAWGPAEPEQWAVKARQVDFYDVKNDVENLFGRRAAQLRWLAAEHPALHPGRSAQIQLDGQVVGWIGELHPRLVQQAELRHPPVVFEIELEALLPVPMAEPGKLSRQPIVTRDLAFWVDNTVSYQQILDTLNNAIQADPQLQVVQDIRLFDVWRDQSATEAAAEKSMALHFLLQSPEVTLDDETIEACVAQLLQALVAQHNVRQRA